MKKKGSQNKFFTCIRPVVDIDSMLEPKTTVVDRSSSRRFSCIPAVSEKHEEDWINVTQSNPPKRKLAKVIKAVLLFETLLNKRAQHKNHFGSSKGCFPVYSSSSSSPSSSMDTKTKKALELYSPVSKSKDTSKHVNPNNRDHQLLESYKTFRCIIGVLLFLISLSITIIWGKFKGIVLTSIWLYFISLLITCFRRRTTKIMV
ncbi:hypothetical protein HN51_019479 [Arachis hypogaea]|uniref:Transmembrane protein n=1 Tax=Arachis hypogaea TaxID=3818 RepID=A0A445BX07_ARAHY|nr:uncharacterized protein LOC112708397 [Arachis hypogaea]QHO31250.1 uncharacterized protein DS421_8g239970 [Arachis hypogaea]RYR43269.1 hypothetical protein Ahy_A08g039694 [Arachis hypogaea]